MTHHALNLYDYHVWANKTIFDRLKELPRDIYHKKIQSVFPSVSKTVSHIYLTDYCWLNILSGKSMKEALAFADHLKEQTETKSIEEIETMFFDLSEQYTSFFNQQEDLEKTLVLDNPYAGLRETSFSEVVLHVVNHGTYHRGNITAMLHQMGHASVMTDYGLFWYAR
ncbi:DinB family protein [Bacillus sp. DX4.1]|uniref:DinB family protein n=1 Tax=Bacillus sp. DX4.1 TaxID=3055867 RepID=UPI0025A1B739|nr:DinB family protein [Bacillus sp. DX4.1]MDM5188833.1 DinB family protein [Bacillus sp. DX4.1]